MIRRAVRNAAHRAALKGRRGRRRLWRRSRWLAAAATAPVAADLAIATAVWEVLEGQGISCGIVPRDGLAGRLCVETMVRTLNAAQVRLRIRSQVSVALPHVLREVEPASAKRRAVVSVRSGGAARWCISSVSRTGSTRTANREPRTANRGLGLVLPMLSEAVRRTLAPGWSEVGALAGNPESMPAPGGRFALPGAARLTPVRP